MSVTHEHTQHHLDSSLVLPQSPSRWEQILWALTQTPSRIKLGEVARSGDWGLSSGLARHWVRCRRVCRQSPEPSGIAFSSRWLYPQYSKLISQLHREMGKERALSEGSRTVDGGEGPCTMLETRVDMPLQQMLSLQLNVCLTISPEGAWGPPSKELAQVGTHGVHKQSKWAHLCWLGYETLWAGTQHTVPKAAGETQRCADVQERYHHFSMVKFCYFGFCSFWVPGVAIGSQTKSSKPRVPLDRRALLREFALPPLAADKLGPLRY